MTEQTPRLNWLLLTKRPQNIRKMFPDPRTGTKPWGEGLENVWLGTTTENQEEVHRRIPHLIDVPAPVHFLSAEPPLEKITIRDFLYASPAYPFKSPIDWVICGGESGAGARWMDPDWARSLRDQCQEAGVPFFMKQMSRREPIPEDLRIRQFPIAQQNTR